jgi:hypothetical protein
VTELNRIHIHAQCVNWNAGISYPHSRACQLIGSFCLGFTFCDDKERDSYGNIIFRCSFIGYSFVGFHIVVSGNVFLCLTMIQKRKNIKTLGNLINRTNQIASCFDALSITYAYSCLYWIALIWIVLNVFIKIQNTMMQEITQIGCISDTWWLTNLHVGNTSLFLL